MSNNRGTGPEADFPIIGGGRPGRAGSSRRVSRPPIHVELVDFDALYGMGAVVLEPVPVESRSQYRYWRGANLMRIAMNFSRGLPVLNTGDDAVTHFTDNYSYARNVAADNRLTQFSERDRQELSAATGRDPQAPLPRIVYALAERFNETELPEAYHGHGRGFRLEARLEPDMVDPYSQELLEQLLR